MAQSSNRIPRFIAAVLTAAVLAACGDDSTNPPPVGSEHVLVVTTVSELEDALTNSAAGDTIEIRAEFSSPTFALSKGFAIPADRSPITIMGSPKAGFLRPTITFPAGVAGLTLTGHSGSVIQDLDFTGGGNVIIEMNCAMTIQGCTFMDNTAGDFITVNGGPKTNLVTNSLFVNPARFGVSTHASAGVTIEGNTVINANDCGLYLDSNATVRRNLSYASHVYGIVCFQPSPTIECNDCFMSGSANYSCDVAGPLPESNYELDPKFCGETYFLTPLSPLLEVNSGGCGQIGVYGVGSACQP